MSRLKDRLLNYHIQVKKFADDDQMILANDVLSMIEQLQDDLKWYEKPKLTKTEKSFLEALDPSWSYMLRNGKGQLYLPASEGYENTFGTGGTTDALREAFYGGAVKLIAVRVGNGGTVGSASLACATGKAKLSTKYPRQNDIDLQLRH